MLLAVEGGGFFSSSASGYSKGLTLLLSGRPHEDPTTPMRVSPWNTTHFHLLDQHDPDPDPDHLHLAPKKKIRRGCASFFCFRRATIEGGPSPPKVGPARHPSAAACGGEEGGLCGIEDEESGLKVYLKSSLKKGVDCNAGVGGDSDARGVVGEEEEAAERRKVRWIDACGRELAEIREFEASEAGASDEESDGKGDRGCSCWIQ